MGIRCIGFEIICNWCGKSAGKFDTFEKAEKHIPVGWKYWFPSLDIECTECARERAQDEDARKQ